MNNGSGDAMHLFCTNCQNLTEGSQLLECPDTQQCSEFFLQYSPWGACSQL